LLVSNGALSTGNGALLVGNGALSTGNGVLLVGNGALSTGNGALLVGNGALSTGNGALLVGTVAMPIGVGILSGDNVAMPTNKMTTPHRRARIRGKSARNHASVRCRTDDKASTNSMTQRISADVHLPSLRRHRVSDTWGTGCPMGVS